MKGPLLNIIATFVSCLIWQGVSAQCNFTITADETEICEKEAITFGVTPASDVDSIEWDFGFKKVKNNNSPLIIFTSPGKYSCEITIITKQGATCTIDKKDWIIVNSQPIFGSTGSPSNLICDRSQEVKITNSSTEAVSWSWTIEGKVYDTKKGEVKHTFQNTGTPLIQLVIESKEGCINKKVYDDLLTVANKPKISLDPQVLCTKPASASFTPKYTMNGQSAQIYNWKFDGTTIDRDNKKIPSAKTYRNLGKYDVRLFMKTRAGCDYRYDFRNNVEVYDRPQAILRAYRLNKAGCNTETFAFGLSGNLDPTDFTWDLPKNQIEEITRVRKDSLIIRFNKAGSHAVKVVLGKNPCTKVLTSIADVKSNDAEANFESDSCICLSGMPTLFENESTSLGNLGFEWTVYDNNEQVVHTATTEDLKYTFTGEGGFWVELKAIDSDGCYDLKTRFIKVEEVNLENATITELGQTCPSEEYRLLLSNYCSIDSTDIEWFFIHHGDNVIESRHTGWKANKLFDKRGYYDLAIVFDNGECYDSLFLDKVIFVEDCLPSSPLIFTPHPGCVGELSVTVNHKFSDEFEIKSELEHADDSTIIYNGSYDPSIITFIVKKPGFYHFRAWISLEGSSETKYFEIDKFISADQLIIEGAIGKSKGCAPNIEAPLRVIRLENYNYSQRKLQPFTINWAAYPSSSAYVAEPNDTNTTLHVHEPGQVDVELKAVNEAGCEAIWQAVNSIEKSFDPKFSLPKDLCFGDTFRLRNNSTGAIDGFEWASTNADDVFVGGVNTRDPTFIAPTPGKRTITLNVIGKNGCEQSVQSTLNLVDVDLDFSVVDTTPKCSPARFEFVASGKNVKKYHWDFGDGDSIVTKSNRFFKIYDLRRVYPYRNTFSVRLWTQHSSGCRVEVFKKEIIKIKGPYPRFVVDSVEGCSPFKVHFKNESKNVHKLFIDFGDSEAADSQNFETHVYTADTIKEYTTYKPFVVAHDKFDCRTAFYLPDSIKVYAQPAARFVGLPTKACEPQEVKLRNKSRFAKSSLWQIPSASFRSEKRNARVTLNAGLYDVNLVVANKLGCTNEKLRRQYIEIFEKPRADFLAQDSLSCVGSDFYLKDYSFGRSKLVSQEWKIIQNGDYETYFGDSVSLKFEEQGSVNVKLMVQDANGCRDTVLRKNNIQVYDKLPVQSPAYQWISHKNNERIELHYDSLNKAYIKSINLYSLAKESPEALSFRTNNQNLDFEHKLDSAVKSKRCYKIVATDKCNEIIPSDTHCTVFLQVNEMNKELTELKWNHYVGWDKILGYRVKRKIAGEEDYETLAILPAWKTSYIDSSFCDTAYQYKIQALDKENRYVSNSNDIRHKTDFTYQDVPLEITKTTVVNNSYLATHFNKTKQFVPVEYLIDKREQFGAWNRAALSITDTILNDKNALIQDFYYDYRVRVKDACGNISVPSNLGRSVKLEVNQQDDLTILSWNQYRDWPTGVSKYMVEIKKPNSDEFVSLGQTKDSFFIDAQAYYRYKEPYTYRVIAVEQAEEIERDSSYSNYRRVVPEPSVFAPTAFSPNGDGVNDEFNLAGWALIRDSVEVEAFNLVIFNRWGERVFESFDIDDGWNGTFKGQDAQLDQYVWLAKVTALNGDIFFLRGGVLLMR